MPGPDHSGQIEKALICINPRQAWKAGFDGNLAVYDLRYTIAHEIGHAIGLDHPGPSGQVMSYGYHEEFRTLQARDVDGTVIGRAQFSDFGVGTSVAPPRICARAVQPHKSRLEHTTRVQPSEHEQRDEQRSADFHLLSPIANRFDTPTHSFSAGMVANVLVPDVDEGERSAAHVRRPANHLVRATGSQLILRTR
jgi:hypothetical protein